MKILYISSVCSPKVLEYIFNTAIIKPGQAIQKFHRLLIGGFSKNKEICEIEVLSSLPISPNGHTRKIWNIKTDRWHGVSFNYVFTLNIPIIKNLIVFILTFSKVLFWRFKNLKEDKIVISDILNISVFWSAFLACKMTKQPIAVIITDLPVHMVSDSRNLSFFKRVYLQLGSFIIKHVDYYIGLTEQMNVEVNPLGKPFLVMEGLVDEAILSLNHEVIPYKEKKIILYAGGIYEKYGVKKLLDAFVDLKDENYELHIYGDGDLEDAMTNYTELDTRIHYFGVVPNSVVVQELFNASLLVNPRPASEEFTKFSFPSKNMEYMVSGTPLLTTVLPGMPKEYHEYVYLLEDESLEGFRNTIQEILSKSSTELNAFGKKSKDFVLNNKSNVIQAKRIINFLNSTK